MELHQKQDAFFSVRASPTEGENIISIHTYDSDDQPLDVKTISYPSQTAPVLESFCALENAMASHGIEADIQGQDGTHYHGFVIIPKKLYKIVRFNRKGSRTLFRGLTLEQAQAHCQNPSTEGNGWFDGYTLMTNNTKK